jgi:RND family efflux transporter MFP subunit
MTDPIRLETALTRPTPNPAAPLLPRWCSTLLLSAALLAACGPKPADGGGGVAAASAPAAASGASAATAAGPAASAPPVSVTLVKAQPRDFTITLDANGTVTANSSVDVKPQVSAQVLQVHVKEGQFVKAGQLLFTLDARADQANLAKAQAQLAKDEAALADARRQLARNLDLVAKNFIAQSATDTSQANVDAQQAVVAADRAAIDAVKVQLSFARISAAGAGRIGPIAVFPGSSVTPAGAAMLTITQVDPVAVSFPLPQRNLADAVAALKSPTAGRVTATLPDGQGVRQGRISFVDSAVDASSGTVKVKAQFANADQALWPGAYVTVKMALQTLPEAIVVPLAAIVTGARGTAVFVADKEMKAAIRPVKVLAQAGTEAVVSGLKAGERIVLDGRQNVRPGSTLVERAPEAGRGASGAGRGASAPAGGGSAPMGAGSAPAGGPGSAPAGAGSSPEAASAGARAS